MTLKQLEAFYWAATCSSFTVAARRVHITVSSLSKRIAELEQSMDIQLFDRGLNKATLTDAGRLLLPRALALLEEAESLKKLVSESDEMYGSCKFGVGELSALTWLPKFVSRSERIHPHLLLEPTVNAGSSSGNLEQQVVDGDLDFAVVAARSMRPEIASKNVGQVTFRWVAVPALAGYSRRVTSQVLEQKPLITLPDGTGTTKILVQWLEDSDLFLGRRLTCNSWGAVAGLLTEGVGIGFLPTRWAELLAEVGAVVLLDSDQPIRPLAYVFQRRVDDRRDLIGHMLALVEQSIDFNATGRWLRS